MSASALLLQVLTGLASASTLFLVASGLSLIFGVTRIVNFAHGSFYMLGLYAAVWLAERLGGGPLGFWGGVLLAALAVALLGALLEALILRRLYAAPELYQLLATFALVLVVKDAALWAWGPEDILGPKAPGLGGVVMLFERPFPTYDVFLIFVGPLVLGALWLLLTRTRWGLLIRAATQDREMVGALGVSERWLFTSVFALGTFLAALGGALQMPHEPANLNLDLALIGEAFVIVVVGGMGSIVGAFVAALLIAMVKAFCIAAGTVDLFGAPFPLSRLTLVAEFLVMAVVLVWRPWGLFGRAQAAVRLASAAEAPLRRVPAPWRRVGFVGLALLFLVPLLQPVAPYAVVLMIDVLIAVLFAASLHFSMGPAGLHSFGHAAYFGLGAYGAALFFQGLALPMEAALLLAPLLAFAGALLFGWFCVRLSGVYLAMLTLAFAQIVWSVVYQWDPVTGGSNGLLGIWPADWLAAKPAYYLLTLVFTIAGCGLLVRIVHAPLGLALRGSRDSPLRAAALGLDVPRLQWLAFVVAGTLGGVAGALFAFAKGTISPETLGIGRSVDALVMVLLGGVQAISGPWVGAAVFTWLQDSVARQTDYWRALLGVVMLALVMLFPLGIAGGLRRLFMREPA
ncbi:ABC transporter permease [Piscinibacter koreensis]|uniref:ABC transporter permease n=1 Tax=Piscinibacter koreensis TaxID=2742824 RepID=A0A7Y6NNV3_9BURK|nr:ABC transporter permease [Schlegelella koreensis]NUZ06517.1 ABC transporter permease [Schlegelella koreensis]